MDILMNILDNLWLTYKTMVVLYFMYWIIICIRMHDSDIISLYDDIPNVYMKWFKYIWECISGSFIMSLVWPATAVMFMEHLIKDSMKPWKPGD